MRDDGTGPAARVLLDAVDDRGRTPLDWVAGPLPAGARVLDLRCGDGSRAGRLGTGRWIGVDPTATDGPEGLLRASPAALPLRRNAVDAVTLVLAVPLLRDVDAVFAEIRRVLRPAGTLVALVPSASTRSLADLRLRRVLAPVRRGAWPNRSALDHLSWILMSADFAVMADERVRFHLPLPDPAAAHRLVADLPAAGVWPPGLDADDRAALFDGLADLAGPDRVLPVPMRRVIARR